MSILSQADISICLDSHSGADMPTTYLVSDVATQSGVISMTTRLKARRVAAVLEAMSISELRALVEEMDQLAGNQSPLRPANDRRAPT